MPDPQETTVSQRRALLRVSAGALGMALLVGCTGHSGKPVAMGAQQQGSPVAVAPQAAPELPGLDARLRPDVLVTGRLTGRELRAVRSLAHDTAAFTIGTVRIGKTTLRVASVDPVTFRRYAPAGTAESTALWETVASGQVVASHAIAKQLHLTLGHDLLLAAYRDARVRLGGLATTGLPGTDLVVDLKLGKLLGITSTKGVVLHAGDVDPTLLASRARRAAGEGADVDLLSPPAANPVAFLTGSKAAKAFGAFSYRYYPDGTIVPDNEWVRQNIVSARVPILGTVTCHRLMIPQLRAALQDVVDAGLAATIHTYNGCYVPRFMEHDPKHPVSLHTWGIAIDLDSATNGRGTQGTMDPRVVQIFKRWGFRWGGDWSWTDPMHFELGALLK
jgi:hypothetical protein